MNSIKGILDKSDYEIYDDYLNFQVDGYWLDEKIDELYPDNMYKGIVPTLLFWLNNEKERKIVWQRILPNKGDRINCPILMCPDDSDFSCTLIIAEIENDGSLIKWNRIGIDRTKEFEPEKIGTTVEWFDKFNKLEFELTEYQNMVNQFSKHFEIDKLNWEEKNKVFQEEPQKTKDGNTEMHKSKVEKEDKNRPLKVYNIRRWLTKLWS